MRAIKTKPNLSASANQLALKAKHKLTHKQFGEMLEMLGDLTPAERRRLESPDFITEDEADIIVARRRRHEPTVSLAQVLRENGLVPRRRPRA
jgi:hypothetical protein